MVNSLARAKVSDRRPVILVLDWLLVYTTLIISMNSSPYPNFCKPEKTKSQSTLLNTLTKSKYIKKTFLFSLFRVC